MCRRAPGKFRRPPRTGVRKVYLVIFRLPARQLLVISCSCDAPHAAGFAKVCRISSGEPRLGRLHSPATRTGWALRELTSVARASPRGLRTRRPPEVCARGERGAWAVQTPPLRSASGPLDAARPGPRTREHTPPPAPTRGPPVSRGVAPRPPSQAPRARHVPARTAVAKWF